MREGLLCPFRYFGVPDQVDYRNIPWRSTRFDEEALTQAVATQARADNALEQWRKRGGTRTLGFCVSQRHADFMVEHFRERGVRCAVVHSGPTSAPRASSLEQLRSGELEVLFAVDMFNEGVDVPAVDTVMMLRPTESSILWLQQFGRGLQRAEGKERLVVTDYIGNHRTFLLKPRTLLQLPCTGDRELSQALERPQAGEWEVPPGCEVTYELDAVELLKSLMRLPKADDALQAFYEDFRECQGVRPTASELFQAGYSPRATRKAYGGWPGFVRAMGDLSLEAQASLEGTRDFLNALETTQMSKSYKMLLLQALLNLDALPGEAALEALAEEFGALAGRSAALSADVGNAREDPKALQALLLKNPVSAWAGGKGTGDVPYFALEGDTLRFLLRVAPEHREVVQSHVRELMDWRLVEYLSRETAELAARAGFIAKVIQADGRPIVKLPDRTAQPSVPEGWTPLSVDGVTYEANFAKIAVNVVRRPDTDQNQLPAILWTWFGPDAGQPGTGFLVAYEPTEGGYTLSPASQRAEVKLERWRSYSREQIPPLFGLTFNRTVWQQGFVATPQRLILLVTLDKGNMLEEAQYSGRFLNPAAFQWQSQNWTTQAGKHGQTIRNHEKNGVAVELFVRRESKRDSGTAAPFIY